MKENEFKKFIERYKEGNSTLKEENNFFNNANHSDSSLEPWATFVKNNKREAPKNFNNKLWESFQKKKRSKQRKIIRILSAAASVIILISFLIINQGQKEQSYSEKEKLLSQALDMFDNSEQKEIRYNIFYENEMIIVYTIAE